MMELIEGYEVISIVGMAKNVGKTTTLNYILSHLYHKKKVGLTSIGRDGEKLDAVTNTPKPKIYIESGTIVATTTVCLNNSDFTKQILETTGINTPLGEVVIVKALSDGYVDLAGPSFNQQIKRIIAIFKSYHVDITLIDGAISRKGLADFDVSEATILCTGAAYSSQMKTVIEDTEHFVHLFTLKEVLQPALKLTFQRLMNNAPISLVLQDKSVQQLHLKTALNSAKQITDKLTKEVDYLILRGALTQELLMLLIENRDKFNYLTIIIQHATKCIYDKNTSDLLNKVHIDIQVLTKTDLLCVSINPTSPYGYAFDEAQFLKNFNLKLPIYNVMREKQ